MKKAYKLPQDELAAYISWLQTGSKHHTVGVGNGKQRPPLNDLFVLPFNVSLPPGVYARASATETAYSNMSSKVTGHVLNTLPANTFQVPLKRYSAPRIIWRQGLLGKGEQKTSHVTGAHYLSYGGTSQSVPFGKSTATANESEDAVFEVLKAAFEVSGAIPQGQEVNLQKERFIA